MRYECQNLKGNRDLNPIKDVSPFEKINLANTDVLIHSPSTP